MTSREDKLLTELKKALTASLHQEIVLLKRKLLAMEQAKDNYKAKAKFYQKQLIEARTKK